MGIQNYKELKIWQKGVEIVKESYLLSRLLPKVENFVLVSQIIRSAISIPANIAEGFGRNSKKEFYQFLSIAYGSLLELETHVIIVKEVYLLDVRKIETLVFEEQKMLRVFMSKLN